MFFVECQMLDVILHGFSPFFGNFLIQIALDNLIFVIVDTQPIFFITFFDYNIYNLSIVREYSRLMTDLRIFLVFLALLESLHLYFHKYVLQTTTFVPEVGSYAIS